MTIRFQAILVACTSACLSSAAFGAPTIPLIGTPNQNAVAAALNAGPSSNDMFVGLLPLTDGALTSALNRLSGEIHATLTDGLLAHTFMNENAILNRLVHDPVDEPPAVWVQGSGEWDRFEGVGGTNNGSSRSGGIEGGYDTPVGDGMRLGVAGAYSGGTVHVPDLGSHASTTGYDLALYGEGGDALHLRAGAGHTESIIHTSRSITVPSVQTLTAHYGTQAWYAFGELTYPWKSDNYTLEPLADLNYIHLRTAGFTETGGSAAVTGLAQDQDVYLMTLGARISATMGDNFTPSAMLGWRHAEGDLGATITQIFNSGVSFTSAGTPISRDAAVASVGFDYVPYTGLKLSAAYVGEFSSRVTANGVNVGLNWSL
jgi:outer membrane autotransporter protein